MGYLYTQIARFLENVVIETGQHLTMSIAGILFLGFPVSLSLGAYVFAIIEKTGDSMVLAVIGALCSSLVLGVLFALLYRRLSNDSFAVFSLASVLAFDAVLRSWDSLTGGVLGIPGVSRPGFLSSFLMLVLFQAVVAFLFLLFEYGILRSPLGRSLQAHKESKIFLDSLGVHSKNIGSLAIIFASFSGAVGGIIMIWRIQFLDPTFGGIPILLIVLTMSILAVKPRVLWMVGAVLFVTLLPEILRLFPLPSSIVGHLRLLLYSALLILLVNKLSSGYTSEKRLV